jgi:hypothetical protein
MLFLLVQCDREDVFTRLTNMPTIPLTWRVGKLPNRNDHDISSRSKGSVAALGHWKWMKRPRSLDHEELVEPLAQ